MSLSYKCTAAYLMKTIPVDSLIHPTLQQSIKPVLKLFTVLDVTESHIIKTLDKCWQVNNDIFFS